MTLFNIIIGILIVVLLRTIAGNQKVISSNQVRQGEIMNDILNTLKKK